MLNRVVCLAIAALLSLTVQDSWAVGSEKMKAIPIQQRNSGYVQQSDDWHRFLTCWAERQSGYFRANKLLSKFEWSGSARAANSEIARATIRSSEARLGVKLPKSYVDFVVAGGAFFRFGFPNKQGAHDFYFMDPASLNTMPKALPEAFRALQDWVSIGSASDEEYYRYGIAEKQNPHRFRGQYLRSGVVVASLEGEGVILLNPNEKTVDGEWESWLVIWRGGTGVSRYPSFAELMRNVFFEFSHDAPHSDPYAEELLRGTCADLLKPRLDSKS